MNTIPNDQQLRNQLETALRIADQSDIGMQHGQLLVATVQAQAQIRIAAALEQIVANFERATLEDIEAAIARGDFT